VNGSAPPRWTAAVRKAAWTLLLVAAVAYVVWWALKELLVPLLVIIALVGILCLAVGWFQRDRW
jgi:Na+/glutamate symporter